MRRVFDRLSSPRWREVILLGHGQLAMGHDGNEKFWRSCGA